MFGDKYKFNPEEDLRLVKKIYTKDGKILKSEDFIEYRVDEFYGVKDHWRRLRSIDEVIELLDTDLKYYGIKENA